MTKPTLADLGERRIIREVLPRYCSPAGDDCAAFTATSDRLVITTDPVPEPAAKLLGGDPDLYWMGWLLVTINISDIAAAGAMPSAFVAAIEAPPDLPVADFERLLLGIREACDEYGAHYVGGNLKENAKIAATGTAVGECVTKHLSRSGVCPGDVLLSVGQGGIFWRDALAVLTGGNVPDKGRSPLFKPLAQVRAMVHLHSLGLVSAAIDNSDGLLASLQQLATINEVGIEIDIPSLRGSSRDAAGKLDDPARCWLGWGDWNVIVAVRAHQVVEAVGCASEQGHVVIPIGRATSDSGRLTLSGASEKLPAPRIESERFAKDSWFSAGIQSYVNLLSSVRLPE